MADETLPAETRPIADIVKEQIQRRFVSLIPEDHWDKLIASAIRDATGPQRVRGHDGVWIDGPSKLEELARDEVLRLAKEELARVFAQPEFSIGKWFDGRMVASELVAEIAKKNAADLLAGMLAPLMMQISQNIAIMLRGR
jgi:hypothetical protein